MRDLKVQTMLTSSICLSKWKRKLVVCGQRVKARDLGHVSYKEWSPGAARDVRSVFILQPMWLPGMWFLFLKWTLSYDNIWETSLMKCWGETAMSCLPFWSKPTSRTMTAHSLTLLNVSRDSVIWPTGNQMKIHIKSPMVKLDHRSCVRKLPSRKYPRTFSSVNIFIQNC